MALAHLLDTSILLRLAKRDNPEHPVIVAAMDVLIEAGADLCYAPQNVVEFWNVLTRPKGRNGFGLTVAAADRAVAAVESVFTCLPDNELIHTEWRRLVLAYGVSGAHVHNARLAAAMRVHGVTRLLTFNGADFARYPDIVSVHPRAVVAETNP